jgi:hypothetical protein
VEFGCALCRCAHAHHFKSVPCLSPPVRSSRRNTVQHRRCDTTNTMGAHGERVDTHRRPRGRSAPRQRAPRRLPRARGGRTRAGRAAARRGAHDAADRLAARAYAYIPPVYIVSPNAHMIWILTFSHAPCRVVCGGCDSPLCRSRFLISSSRRPSLHARVCTTTRMRGRNGR